MSHSGEVLQRLVRAPARTLTLSASPQTLTIGNTGLLAITGGTLSLVEYGRAGTFYTVATAQCVIPVFAGDSVRITYTSAPTVRLIPA